MQAHTEPIIQRKGLLSETPATKGLILELAKGFEPPTV